MVSKRVGMAVALATVFGSAVAAHAGTAAIVWPGNDGVPLSVALETAYGASTEVTSGVAGNGPNSSGSGTNFYFNNNAAGSTLTLTAGAGNTLTFTRLDDTVAQMWVGNSVSGFLVTKVSGNNPESFGVANVADSVTTPLISVTTPFPGGTPTPPAGTPFAASTPSNPFVFYFQDGVDPANFTNTLVGGINNYIATFVLSGTGTYASDTGSYVLAYDDPGFPAGDKDYDFNDLVVQVSPGVGTLPTPLPAAVWGGLSLMGGLGGLGAIKRRRRS